MSEGLPEVFEEIQHKIGPSDTIHGLALHYNVSVDDLKRHNRLHSDDIYYKSELMIPNPKPERAYHFEERQQEKVDEVKRRLKLRNEEDSVAMKLLSQCQWDVGQAVRKHMEDIEWQAKYADLLCVFENRRVHNPFLACKPYNTF